ncbi:MAG: glutamine amidotransferase-related protein [Bacteroidota bacterium]
MIAIIDCGDRRIDQLVRTVDYYDDCFVVSIYDIHKTDWDEQTINGFILSTSALVVNEVDVSNYLDQLELLLEQSKPLLGIGTGHHLISLLFDGQAVYAPYFNDSIEVGIILDDHPLFQKLPLDITMVKEHSGTVSIPASFQLLASSDISINEAMGHRDRPIYGVQFLPEHSGNHGNVIIENFVNISRQKL